MDQMGVSLNRHTKLMVTVLLVVVTILAYAPVRNHEFLQYDDDKYVSENARIQQGLTWENVKWSLTAFEQALWKPVTLLSHMLDCQLFGLNPAGHLLMNLLIHVMNVVVLFGVLYLMTGAMWPSAMVAALFALHPLSVESVAWVAERKNVLSTLFWLLTMWAYVIYTRNPSWKRYMVVMAGLVLGLMTKPMVVTLPCVLLLMDYWPLGRLGNQWKEFRKRLPGLLVEKLPFFVPVAFVSALTIYGVETIQGLLGLQQLSFTDRVGIAFLGYGLYLKKMVWPMDLAVIYPLPQVQEPLSWPVVLSAVVLVGISLWVWTKRRKFEYLIVGWLWYLGTLVPVNGLLQSGGQAMADRYAYVPLIGVFVMLAWSGAEVSDKWHSHRKMLATVGVLVLIVLAILTRIQLQYWQNTATLFEHALKVTSNNFVAHNMLGGVLLEEGSLDEAEEHLNKSLELNPLFPSSHYLLGIFRSKQGNWEEARRHFSRSLEISPKYLEAKPKLAFAHSQLGNVDKAIELYLALLQSGLEDYSIFYDLGVNYMKRGELTNAVEHFEQALQRNPQFMDAHNQLGLAMLQQGRFDQAAEHFLELLDLNPRSHEAYNNLGMLSAQRGDLDQAIKHFEEAIKLEPTFALGHSNLGAALQQTGMLDEALEHCTRALEIDPNLVEARNILGIILYRKGSMEEAVEQFSRVIEIDPGFIGAYLNLGSVLAKENRIEEAVEAFRQALRLEPNNSGAQQSLALVQEKMRERN